MTTRAKHIFSESTAIGFILLYGYTGFDKTINREKFFYSLNQSPVLYSMSSVLSFVIPSIEIALAFLLILPGIRKTGLLLSTILMGLFTIYIAGMLVFGSNLPCSCGGVISLMSWKSHLVLNSFFFILGIWAYRVTEPFNNSLKQLS